MKEEVLSVIIINCILVVIAILSRSENNKK